jgi:cytoskeletal protein RodZ
VNARESLQTESQIPTSRIPSRSLGGYPEEVSSDATEVKPLRRSAVHQMKERNDRFFSSRVIVASVVAVLLLAFIGWYLLSDDSDEEKATVQKETPTTTETTTASQETKQTASPSTEETTSEEPDLTKIEPGLYHLTGTDQAKIIIKPKTSLWVQIRDNNNVTSQPKKYIKDVTVDSEAVFQYTHTFSGVNDLYIVLGSVDNVEITVNDIPVKAAKLIHIVKK